MTSSITDFLLKIHPEIRTLLPGLQMAARAETARSPERDVNDLFRRAIRELRDTGNDHLAGKVLGRQVVFQVKQEELERVAKRRAARRERREARGTPASAASSSTSPALSSVPGASPESTVPERDFADVVIPPLRPTHRERLTPLIDPAAMPPSSGSTEPGSPLVLRIESPFPPSPGPETARRAEMRRAAARREAAAAFDDLAYPSGSDLVRVSTIRPTLGTASASPLHSPRAEASDPGDSPFRRSSDTFPSTLAQRARRSRRPDARPIAPRILPPMNVRGKVMQSIGTDSLSAPNSPVVAGASVIPNRVINATGNEELIASPLGHFAVAESIDSPLGHFAVSEASSTPRTPPPPAAPSQEAADYEPPISRNRRRFGDSE